MKGEWKPEYGVLIPSPITRLKGIAKKIYKLRMQIYARRKKDKERKKIEYEEYQIVWWTGEGMLPDELEPEQWGTIVRKLTAASSGDYIIQIKTQHCGQEVKEYSLSPAKKPWYEVN